MSYMPELYMHPQDKAAMLMVEKIPVLPKLMDLYLNYMADDPATVETMCGAVQLSEERMAEIYNLLPPVCEKLGIDVPELYYVEDDQIEAWTCGSTKPRIVITSGLVKANPDERIRAVLAHECGHIACGHCRYYGLVNKVVECVSNMAVGEMEAFQKYVSPAVVSSLSYWRRCSELSADRAAVLCDESAGPTVRFLMQLDGVGGEADQDAYIRQAEKYCQHSGDVLGMVRDFLLRSDAHSEHMVRIGEVQRWVNSDQFQQLLAGTCSNSKNCQQEEVISGQIVFGEPTEILTEEQIAEALCQINEELSKATARVSKVEQGAAVLCGLGMAALDTFVPLDNLFDGGKAGNDEGLQQTFQSLGKRMPGLQAGLNGKSIDISVLNEYARQSGPAGLGASILVQLVRCGVFGNVDGGSGDVGLPKEKRSIAVVVVPAVLVGTLNFMVNMADHSEEVEGSELFTTVLSSASLFPMLKSVAAGADRWLCRLANGTVDVGEDVPGLFVSLLEEIANFLQEPFKSSLLSFTAELVTSGKFDFKKEAELYKVLAKQSVPVIINDLLTRCIYFILRLREVLNSAGEAGWSSVLPFGNRTVDRMLAISSMTFNAADIADAAVRAAMASNANFVLFAQEFVKKFNFIGEGRAVFSLVKEVSWERKEAQLIHDRLILQSAKTALAWERVQQFQQELEETLNIFLAEDLEQIALGFADISAGFETNDSDLMIRGNVRIQKMLGRDVQFASQEEFDDLMDSGLDLIL